MRFILTKFSGSLAEVILNLHIWK